MFTYKMLMQRFSPKQKKEINQIIKEYKQLNKTNNSKMKNFTLDSVEIIEGTIYFYFCDDDYNYDYSFSLDDFRKKYPNFYNGIVNFLSIEFVASLRDPNLESLKDIKNIHTRQFIGDIETVYTLEEFIVFLLYNRDLSSPVFNSDDDDVTVSDEKLYIDKVFLQSFYRAASNESTYGECLSNLFTSDMYVSVYTKKTIHVCLMDSDFVLKIPRM